MSCGFVDLVQEEPRVVGEHAKGSSVAVVVVFEVTFQELEHVVFAILVGAVGLVSAK